MKKIYKAKIFNNGTGSKLLTVPADIAKELKWVHGTDVCFELVSRGVFLSETKEL
jgi:antitoxin component of MazEF toxin-antitoxin module